MFRIIALAFVIAKSSVYADHWYGHEEEPDEWQFIFPDEVFY